MNFEEWQEIKEEFGDEAYKRINAYANNILQEIMCNRHIQTALTSKVIYTYKTELKPLPELFAHDVEVYGENAYLMWEYYFWTDEWKKFSDNEEVFITILKLENKNDVRRKQSAALPFDLERAKAGDAVEWCCGSIVKNVENVSIANRDDYAITGYIDMVQNTFFCIEHLRMKYPQRIK